MIEPQKKTPFDGQAPAQDDGRPSSLIERAMRAFDQRQFVPPSSPSDLLSPSLTPQQPPVQQPQPAPQEQYAPQAPAPQAPVPQAPAPQAPYYAAQPAPQAPAPQAYAPAPQPTYAPAPQAYAPQPAYAPAPQAHSYHRVNLAALAEEGIALPGSTASAQQEEFRIVKRQLLAQADDLRRQSAGPVANRIMVTSALPGEGKTFCAISLALSIAAEKDTEVLLVDLDMARFSVLEKLGLPAGLGLIDAIANPQIEARDLVMTTDVPGFAVLSGGRPSSLDSEALASARAAQVLDALVAEKPNRIILFDTPPALAASLPAEVAKLSGQVVMVVQADKTSGSAVQDARQLLAGCPNVQLLLNGVQFSPSGRRFGSYHGYRG